MTEELPQRFEDRVLAVDEAIAHGWGRLTAMGRAVGRPLDMMDGFIAATAVQRSLILVTRNVADFEAVGGVRIVNPWHDG